MFKKSLAMVLSATLLTVGFLSQSAFSQDSKAIQEIQIKVAKLGVGRDARIEAKLLDGSKVKGYISAAENDSFTVTDSKSGAVQTIPYANVVSVKKSSRGLSPLTWGIIGGAAAAAIIVGVTVVKPVLCDGGAGC